MADIGVQPRATRSVFGQFPRFEALNFPNYRLWFAGQLVSLVGSWMQTTAQGFLVYQLTSSPVYLGIVAFAAGVPSWIFMLYGGVVADRVPRRTILLVTQTSLMLFAFILAALTFTGLVQAWQIVVLAFCVGVANAFDAPARIAFVRELVDKEAMSNGIALNASMFQLATVVGPAVAGVTYALVGPALCFAINGVSYIAVIVALALMKIPRELAARHATSGMNALREGLRYVASHTLIRTIILIALVISLFGMGYVALMPAWAVDVLGGDATTNGLLVQWARGVGALIGALMVASLGNFKRKGELLMLGGLLFPILLIIFALVNTTWLSLLVLVGIG